MPEMEYDDEDELMIILDDAEKSGRNEVEPELELLKSRSQSRERPGSRGPKLPKPPQGKKLHMCIFCKKKSRRCR